MNEAMIKKNIIDSFVFFYSDDMRYFTCVYVCITFTWSADYNK